MLHCIACNRNVPPWEDYCEECKEAISLVYVDDTAYADLLKAIHPSDVPFDFVSVNYVWSIDQN